jgi:hypothetical protein
MIRANTLDQLDLVVNVRDDQARVVVVIHGLAKRRLLRESQPHAIVILRCRQYRAA